MELQGPIKSPFSDSFLLDYSAEHLRYEVEMLFQVRELRRHPSFPFIGEADSRWMNNVLSESLAVHVRNIIEFLYTDGKFKTDVVASNFFDGTKDWAQIRPTLSSVLKDARKRSNTQLTHLTTHRIGGTLPEKEWSVDKIVNELRSVLNVFVDNALPERLSPQVANAIR